MASVDKSYLCLASLISNEVSHLSRRFGQIYTCVMIMCIKTTCQIKWLPNCCETTTCDIVTFMVFITSFLLQKEQCAGPLKGKDRSRRHPKKTWRRTMEIEMKKAGHGILLGFAFW